jgi:hypothetical protein
MKLNDTSRLLIARSERLDRESGVRRSPGTSPRAGRLPLAPNPADVQKAEKPCSEFLEFVVAQRDE